LPPDLGGMTRTDAAASANAETTEAWDGPLYDRFVRFRDVIVPGLRVHGEEALRLFPPQPGQRVVDIGCGFGDTTQRIAELVGSEGEAVGVDVGTRFIDSARTETAALGIANARFEVADVQFDDLGGPYDMAFSRMGTMFFANPVAALRNVRSALKPGAPLVMVVWRRREDNEWLYRAQTIVEQIVQRPEEYDEPTCGPGPFSMAGADTTSDILLHSGFEDIELRRCDLPMFAGRTVADAIELVMALGPAGEILRLWGDRMAHVHEEVHAALEQGLGDYASPEGVIAPASTWIVSALNPG
jgi:ubiquinone/menaquinone biosynthesis C-methylase UbiE